MEIEIYTDGACSGNPGPGGFGVIVKHKGKIAKKYSKGYRLTTNNRMELMAAIFALSKVEGDQQDISLFSDSKYLTDAINQRWIDKWIKTNFIGVKNSDLWKKFLVLYKKHKIELYWIRGHFGHYENEECDKLATSALRNAKNIDHEYEK